MSDMSSLNRENKKQQLRRQIVSAQPGSDHRRPPGAGNDEDSERVIRQAHRKVLKRRILILLLILTALAAAGLILYRYIWFHHFTQYETGWEVKFKEPQDDSYVGYGPGYVKYSKNGAVCYDPGGEVIWRDGYEMKAPIAAAKGDYMAIGDQQGTEIYIFGKSGRVGKVTTTLPIIRITISAKGEVSAILEDARASYMNMFHKDGTNTGNKIKSALANDGYMMDLDVSPDGTQLIFSFMYLENGSLKNKVVFYNFSAVGANAGTLVGGFNEDFANSITPRVKFLSDLYSIAFADDKLVFFSSKNLVSPVKIQEAAVKEKIRSVLYSSEYAAIIVDNGDSGGKYRLDVYRKEGDPAGSVKFDYPYTRADIDGENVLLYNEDSCEVYHVTGKKRFSADFDRKITKIFNGRFPNTLVTAGPDGMREIKFK